MKPVYIYEKTFMRNIYVFHQWDEKKFIEYLSWMKINIRETGNAAGKMYVTDSEIDPNLIILWTRKTNPVDAIAVLVHEAVHVSMEIFDMARIKVDTDNDELQAYHISMIVRETLEGINVQSKNKVKSSRRSSKQTKENRRSKIRK